MKRRLGAEKDTYITNRIINNSFRATDANVGRGGTLDLFKLAGESTYSADGPFISGTSEPIELTRLLLKFNFNPLRELTGSILDINNATFNCTLKLFDVLGGQTLPSNFKLVLYPLSQSFDEGLGRDVISFEDIDVANFITASVSGDETKLWFASGANAQGYAGQENIDIITGSSTLDDLFVEQIFSKGDEDLSMDVTKIVSATLAGLLPDKGFRVSFSESHESDSRTRFVKRFASRHSTNTRLRPTLEVGFNDSTQDHHQNFYFDTPGTLFLNNFVRGAPANITSGASFIPVTGSNSLLLTLTSGTISGTNSSSYFATSVTASQYSVGGNDIVGVYSATLSISSQEPLLLPTIQSAGSVTFNEIWSSLDKAQAYFSGTLTVYPSQRSTVKNKDDILKLNITNLKDAYDSFERPRLRVFAQDGGYNLIFVKTPVRPISIIFDKMYYRIRDVNSDEILIDFDTVTDSTRLSTDSEGMYFDLFMSDFDIGRVYAIDLKIIEYGSEQVFENVGGTFRVDA